MGIVINIGIVVINIGIVIVNIGAMLLNNGLKFNNIDVMPKQSSRVL